MLDTSTCVHALRNKSGSVRTHLLRVRAGELAISSIVAAELWTGVEKSRLKGLADSAVANLLEFIPVLDWSAKAARVYGRIRTALEAEGLIIGAMDLLIAAHAVSEDAILVTDNVREFSRVADLKLQNWIGR